MKAISKELLEREASKMADLLIGAGPLNAAIAALETIVEDIYKEPEGCETVARATLIYLKNVKETEP